ncbi:hypothetical protein ADK91_32770 [Streptomyces sp. XY511]|uniref:hypothetical protein n=1 Tax=Streptomyces sp. XY511 TaxID=1519480 RepID=UPI0006AE06BB|nr:hypothetical protein [Streptomyces sp. XY511]KOU97406.1 hypothetical protein ADK91_32770 [Streptomyces sp. XY511]
MAIEIQAWWAGEWHSLHSAQVNGSNPETFDPVQSNGNLTDILQNKLKELLETDRAVTLTSRGGDSVIFGPGAAGPFRLATQG